MAAYSDIESHRAMVLDAVRNGAYSRALRRTVTTSSTVLDLGAGLGTHGLFAARLGARRVFLVDPSPVVAHARELARLNGVGDRVEILRGRIEEVELPEPVDLIVSVFTGNFLLTEDLLPLVLHARDRFLRPGGRLLPGKARMRLAAVRASGFFEARIGCWSQARFDIDYSCLRGFAANAVHYAHLHEIDAELLSAAVTLLELDLAVADSTDCRADTELRIGQQGHCHGLLGWFDIELAGNWLSTGPQAQPTHWRLAFLPMDPPLEVAAGDRLRVAVDRPEFGEWTWTVTHREVTRRHSSFHSRRADLEYLKSQAETHVPGLGPTGELAAFVLRGMAEGLSTGQLLDGARAEFGGRYALEGRLEREIRLMIEAWKDKGR